MPESQNDSSTRYPYGVCADEWPTLEHVLWPITVVKYCVRMLIAEYEHIAEPSQSWYCPNCGTANRSMRYEIPFLNNSQHIGCSSANTKHTLLIQLQVL